MRYKAFLSYSHAADNKLAPAIQSALHRFAKPWYRLRAVRVFRDKTNLSVTPGLWPSIEKALSESEYFLFMASQQAAQSQWVEQEIDWWLRHRSTEKLLILLTDGELLWDRATRDFDWRRTTALPVRLCGSFADEPLHVDFRWAKTVDKLSLRHSQFRAAILDVAATLRGKEKDDLDSEDVRQYRRTKRLVWSAVTSLLLLTLIAFWQRSEAERQRQVAVARQLAAQAEVTRNQRAALVERSVLLAVEAMRRFPSLEADQSLRQGVALLRPLTTITRLPHKDTVSTASFSADGRYLATGSEDKTARVWEVSTGREVTRLPHEDSEWAVSLSADGRYLATSGQGGARVWEVSTGRGVTRLPHKSAGLAASLSADGRYLATSGQGGARVWEVSTGREVARSRGGGTWPMSLSADGRYLATGTGFTTMVGGTNDVRVWDEQRAGSGPPPPPE